MDQSNHGAHHKNRPDTRTANNNYILDWFIIQLINYPIKQPINLLIN